MIGFADTIAISPARMTVKTGTLLCKVSVLEEYKMELSVEKVDDDVQYRTGYL